MPITGPTSYVSTTEQFLNHWADANAALAPAVLSLSKDTLGTVADVLVADLTTLKTQLDTARDAVEQTLVDISVGRAELDTMKEQMHDLLLAFNDAINADLARTPYARVLEPVPGTQQGREAFLKPVRNTLKLWVKVNAFLTATGSGTPLSVKGLTQSEANDQFLNLRGQWELVEEREQQVGIERGKRDDVQAKIYPILKAYRQKVPTKFPPGSALVTSLPLLTPLPGSTPQPPALAGAWNAATGVADLTGTASTSASVVRHQLRGCPSEDYSTDDEAVVATLEGAVPLVFHTTFGLTVAGELASFRLYAMTADGHEAGSDTAVIARPT